MALSLLGQQQAQLPNFTGLTGPQYSFGTTFMQPQPPVKNFFDKLPTGPQDGRNKAITSVFGGARTMPTVYLNAQLGQNTRHPYARELRQGHFLFNLQKFDPRGKEHMTVLNLRQVNTLLEEGYTTAFKLWSNKTRVVQAKVLTSEEYDLLFDTPTVKWQTYDFFNKMLLNQDFKDYHCIRYLYEEGCRSLFTFIGCYQNQDPVDTSRITIGIAHAGSIDAVENVFSNELISGEHVGFVFKRFFNPDNQKYGAFKFVPWHGDEPIPSNAIYDDFFGCRRSGVVTKIGTFDRWLEKDPKMSLSFRFELHGILPAKRPVNPNAVVVGCARYHFEPRKGLRIPWYF